MDASVRLLTDERRSARRVAAGSSVGGRAARAALSARGLVRFSLHPLIRPALRHLCSFQDSNTCSTLFQATRRDISPPQRGRLLLFCLTPPVHRLQVFLYQ